MLELNHDELDQVSGGYVVEFSSGDDVVSFVDGLRGGSKGGGGGIGGKIADAISIAQAIKDAAAALIEHGKTVDHSQDSCANGGYCGGARP